MITLLINMTFPTPVGQLTAGTPVDDLLSEAVLQELIRKGQAREEAEPAESDTELGGVVDQEGRLIQLKDMEEPVLRKLGEDLDIEGHDTLEKEALVRAILEVEFDLEDEEVAARRAELEAMKVGEQLKPLAKQLEIEGADTMKGADLIEAILDKEFPEEGGEQ